MRMCFGISAGEYGMRPDFWETIAPEPTAGRKLLVPAAKTRGLGRQPGDRADCRRLERFQPLLDFAHATRQGKFTSVLEHDDVFAARRRLNGLDAV